MSFRFTCPECGRQTPLGWLPPHSAFVACDCGRRVRHTHASFWGRWFLWSLWVGGLACGVSLLCVELAGVSPVPHQPDEGGAWRFASAFLMGLFCGAPLCGLVGTVLGFVTSLVVVRSRPVGATGPPDEELTDVIHLCGRCRGRIARNAAVCPHCDSPQAGIRCRRCGFVGFATDFRGGVCRSCNHLILRRLLLFTAVLMALLLLLTLLFQAAKQPVPAPVAPVEDVQDASRICARSGMKKDFADIFYSYRPAACRPGRLPLHFTAPAG